MSDTNGFVIGCDYAGTLTVSNETERHGHLWQDEQGDWTTLPGLVRINLDNTSMHGISLTYEDARIMALAILGMTE